MCCYKEVTAAAAAAACTTVCRGRRVDGAFGPCADGLVLVAVLARSGVGLRADN